MRDDKPVEDTRFADGQWLLVGLANAVECMDHGGINGCNCNRHAHVHEKREPRAKQRSLWRALWEIEAHWPFEDILRWFGDVGSHYSIVDLVC